MRLRWEYVRHQTDNNVNQIADGPGIDVYTFKAVAQDDFSDIQIPDAPVQSAHTPNIGVDRAAAAPAVKKAPETR